VIGTATRPTPPTSTLSPTISPTASHTATASPTWTPTVPPSQAGGLRPMPNPFRGAGNARMRFVFEPAAEARLFVYDQAGALAAEVPQDAEEAARGQAWWDGRGRDGKVLPSGLYFAVLRAPGRSAFCKLTLLR